MVQPFVGIYGARADRIEAWGMRKPAGAEGWIPPYPKKLLAKGANGMEGVAMGKARVGPDVVGPIGEKNVAIPILTSSPPLQPSSPSPSL